MANIIHIVQNAQSLLDIALERYGCVEGIDQLLLDNPVLGGSYTATPPVGTRLVITAVPQLTDQNQAIAGVFAARKTEIASGSQFIPRALSYVYGAQRIEITNSAPGDHWTIHVPFDAPGVVGDAVLDHASVRILYYVAGVEFMLVDQDINVPTDYSFSEGACTYYAAITYHFIAPNNIPFLTASQMVAMVDGAGTVIRSLHVDGMVDVVTDGNTISMVANFDAVNCPSATFNGFLAVDQTFTNFTMLGNSDPAVNDLLPPYSFMFLIALVNIDYSDWTDGPFNVDIPGSCIMTLTTNN